MKNAFLQSGSSPPAASNKAARLHTVSDVLALPLPQWLIKSFLERDSFTMVYGKPGSAKSFLALDLALHVATGHPWHGHKVTQGPVVYIAAEGKKGIRKRVQAFLHAHPDLSSTQTDQAFFVLEAVHLTTPADLDALAAEIEDLGVTPALIVVDTFARCFFGDENSAGEVGNAIRALDQLRRRLDGPSILLVHHTDKKGATYRGSSALHGALDSMIEVQKTGNRVTVCNDKQKDEEAFNTQVFKLRVVRLGEDEEGDPLTSCVLEWSGQEGEEPGTSLTDGQQRCLRALLACGPGPVANTEWRNKALWMGVSESGFNHAKEPLQKQGYIEASGDGRQRKWNLTDSGAATAKQLQQQVGTEGLSTAATATLSKEGGAAARAGSNGGQRKLPPDAYQDAFDDHEGPDPDDPEADTDPGDRFAEEDDETSSY